MRAARVAKARDAQDELPMQEFHGVGQGMERAASALPPAKLPPPAPSGTRLTPPPAPSGTRLPPLPAPSGPRLPPPAPPPPPPRPLGSARDGLLYEPETDLSVQRALLTAPGRPRSVRGDDFAKPQRRDPAPPPRGLGGTAAMPAYDDSRSVVELRPEPYASVEPRPEPFGPMMPVPPPPDSASRVQIFDGPSSPSAAQGPALPAFTVPLAACRAPAPAPAPRPVSSRRPAAYAPPPRAASPWPAPPPGAPPIVYPGPFQLAPAVQMRPRRAFAFAAAETRVSRWRSRRPSPPCRRASCGPTAASSAATTGSVDLRRAGGHRVGALVAGGRGSFLTGEGKSAGASVTPPQRTAAAPGTPRPHQVGVRHAQNTKARPDAGTIGGRARAGREDGPSRGPALPEPRVLPPGRSPAAPRIGVGGRRTGQSARAPAREGRPRRRREAVIPARQWRQRPSGTSTPSGTDRYGNHVPRRQDVLGRLDVR